MLARAVEEWTETPKVAATEMVIPLLTLELLKGDPTFGQKAEAIIHESYHRYLAGTATPADLHLLRLCPDYCPSPSNMERKASGLRLPSAPSPAWSAGRPRPAVLKSELTFYPH